MANSLNAFGTDNLIQIIREWNTSDITADKAVGFIADLLTDTFGSDVLDVKPRPVYDGQGNALAVDDIVIVPHPAGAHRGKVTEVGQIGTTGHAYAHVLAPGYIRGNGKLGFAADCLTKVFDDGSSPVVDWAKPVQPRKCEFTTWIYNSGRDGQDQLIKCVLDSNDGHTNHEGRLLPSLAIVQWA